jgi:hypothetical protein
MTDEERPPEEPLPEGVPEIPLSFSIRASKPV